MFYGDQAIYNTVQRGNQIYEQQIRWNLIYGELNNRIKYLLWIKEQNK